MENQLLLTHRLEDIATINFNRPKKKNAITLEMWKQIPAILAELEADTDIRVVIFRGIDEKVFSAGADISEFSTERARPIDAMNYDTHITNAGDAIENFSKPLIARIEGPCIGGACEIALACDLRFSSMTGVFGITPAKIGLVYGLPQTKRLVRTVGPSRAKDILFSGRFINAHEAYDIGFLDRVYPSNKIIEETYNYARLLGKMSQTTIRGAKKIIQTLFENTEENNDEVRQIIYDSYYSPDIQEGVAAFKEKRLPQFEA
jgi:enoyl-CoA hydratase/carnithine racemase